MIPKSMQEDWWLAPWCIISMTLGMFILVIYLFPGFAPEMHERMVRRGLDALAPLAGGMNILAPAAALWYHCRQEEMARGRGRAAE